jgi:predicted DNA-binding transcriptional regulator AlpA
MRPDPRPPARDSDEVFLNARAVIARYGVSPMWIWRRLRDESGFPAPITIATRRYWRLSSLVEWERSKSSGATG